MFNSAGASLAGGFQRYARQKPSQFEPNATLRVRLSIRRVMLSAALNAAQKEPGSSRCQRKLRMQRAKLSLLRST